MELTGRARYPWQQAQWARLWPAERLGHALLLAGLPGLGKQDFAAEAARALLCQQPEQGACGACKSCRLWDARIHPDLFVAEPLEPGKPIVVDRVRDLIEFLNLKPHTSARKVAIVHPAEALNVNAANSLLKALEEPPGESYLLLVAHHPERLLPTLRSRCQRLDFVAPDPAQAHSWLAERGAAADAALALAFAGGAPLRAQTLLEQDFPKHSRQWAGDLGALLAGRTDPVTVAARWKKAGGALVLEWMQHWLGALIRYKLGVAGDPGPEAATELQAQSQVLDLTVLFPLADAVGEARKLTREPLDELLLLEDVLVRWVQLPKRR